MATVIPSNQATFTLAEVAAICKGQLVEQRWGQLVTTSVQTDSRRVTPGALFVPLRGERFDAHKFLNQIQASGAVAALALPDAEVPVDLPVVRVNDTLQALGDLASHHRRRWGGTVVAITGSAGKTTTKELTYAALCAASDVGASAIARTEGNLNNLIGVPMTLLSLASEHKIAVVELGTNQPGEIARLASIAQPQIGVVTSVAMAHAEGLGSLAGVAAEKTDLLRALSTTGIAMYNVDSDPLVRAARGLLCSTVTFGTSEHADVRLESERLVLGDEGLLASSNCYRVPGLDAVLEVQMAMLGHGAAVDTAAALAVVRTLCGLSAVKKAALGLQRVMPGAGRMKPLSGVNGSLVLDDTYNANPASMEASLRSLREIAKIRGGRAFAALGEMKELGAHARESHRKLGQLCGKFGLAGVVGYGVAMTDAIEAAREAGVAQAVMVENHARASELIARELRLNDVVLVKGSRSMTMEHVVTALCQGVGSP